MFKQYLDLPRPVYILCLGTLVNRSGMFLLLFMTLYITSELGMSEQTAGLVMGAFGAGSIVGGLLGGYLADRVGRRPVMIASMFSSPPLIVLFGQVHDAASLVAVAMVLAVVGDMYRPATSAMIADLVPALKRPHAFGLMYLAINLGAAIAPVAGGLLSGYSFKWLFWADATTTAVYGAIITASIAETLPRRRPAAPGESAAPSATRAILNDKIFLSFCAAILMLALVYMQCFSSFPLYMKHLGYTAQTFGLVIAVNGALIVCLQVPITAWITRYHRGRVLVWAAVIQALGFAVIPPASSSVLLLAGTVVVWTFAEMMMAPLTPTIVSDLAPQALRGRYMGVFNISYASANVLGAPLGTMLLGNWGGPALWYACGLFSLLAGAVFFAVRNRLARRDHGDAGREL